MDLPQLRAFVAIAREGSIRRAAEYLGLAQPPLTRRLRRLEADLGVRLFTRGSAGVSLTASGASLLERALPVLEAFERLELDARALAAGGLGRVRVAYTSNLGYGFIGAVVARVRELQPDVVLDLHEESYARQLDLLRQGELDVGLLTLPIHEPAMVTRPLHSESLRVILPEGHPLGAQERVELSALAEEPFVLCPRYGVKGFHEHLLGLLAGAGFTPRIAQEVEQKHTIERMIASGIGISILPTSALAAPLPGVVHRDTNPALPPIQNAAVWHELRPPEGAARRFVDAARHVATEA